MGDDNYSSAPAGANFGRFKIVSKLTCRETWLYDLFSYTYSFPVGIGHVQ